MKMNEINRHHSKETKKKISKAMMGKKHSDNWKKRQSEIMKGNSHAKGNKLTYKHRQAIIKAHKGKIFSKKTRRKLSDKAKQRGNNGNRNLRRGNECHFWKGGISFEPYSVDWTETLKRSIRQRDNYICQICNQYGNEVHHINYDKKNCNPNNLITLCKSCHRKTNGNRKHWKNHFYLITNY